MKLKRPSNVGRIRSIADYQKKLLISQHYIVLTPKTDNERTMMQMCFRLPYLDPELGYNPSKVARYWPHDKTELKHVLIHELCHIVIDPLYGCAIDRHASRDEIERARETLTDHLAMIVMRNGI